MDWAELNSEIVCLIAQRVGDISNFIRLRAVCKNWRIATNPSDLPQQLPYLIKCERTSGSSFEIQFRPLFSNKLYTLPIQISQLQGEPTLYGSLTGYILLHFFEYSTWLLINPLTGFQVPLPFELDNCFRPIYFGPSCKPKSADKEIDVLFAFAFEEKDSSSLIGYLKVCLWRYADRNWTRITEIFCSDKEHLRYSNGRLYAISIQNGDTRVIDVNTGDVVSLIRGSHMDKIQYVTEAYGDVLAVQLRQKRNILNQVCRGHFIEVYQLLENGGTNPRWERINGNNIGDRMLFFEINGSNLCLKASDFKGCRSGMVYIMDLPLHNGSCIMKKKMFVPSLLSPP